METSFDVRLSWYVLRGFLLGTHCTPPTRLYVLPGAPCYLLLFLLLFPSASRICFPMCFFLGASCLLRIAGGGAAPSPCTPHPLVFLTDAPCDLLLFLWLFPLSSSTMWVLLASYVCHATHCRGEGTVRPAFML